MPLFRQTPALGKYSQPLSAHSYSSKIIRHGTRPPLSMQVCRNSFHSHRSAFIKHYTGDGVENRRDNVRRICYCEEGEEVQTARARPSQKKKIQNNDEQRSGTGLAFVLVGKLVGKLVKFISGGKKKEDQSQASCL